MNRTGLTLESPFHLLNYCNKGENWIFISIFAEKYINYLNICRKEFPYKENLPLMTHNWKYSLKLVTWHRG